MRKLSRRHKTNVEKPNKIIYSNLEEAIKLLKLTATAKFIETVELHANLNIDSKHIDQQLHATVILPNSIKKQLKIAVLTNKENFLEAKSAGADIIGDDDLIEQIRQKNINFDLLLVTPNIMPKLIKLGRILESKNIMPSLKSGTLTNTLSSALIEFKKGKFEYKTDKTGILHVKFGKTNFENSKLIENLQILYKSIKQNQPSGIKGKYFKSLFICSTMGSSIQLDLNIFS